MKCKAYFRAIVICIILTLLLFANQSFADVITFTKLTGETGGSPAATAVYRADLSGILYDILSLKITDGSFGLGGSPGQFSGFDLDAIKLSSGMVGTAADASLLAGLSVFDFSPSGTLFTPGSQRPPADPKLFGTGLTGTIVDNSVATLGFFDGNSTTGPAAFGFVSLGDGGVLSFNLTSPVSPSGSLYLYIGEVGDNGEVAAGRIEVSQNPQTPVPEPATMLLLGSGLLGLAGYGRRKIFKI